MSRDANIAAQEHEGDFHGTPDRRRAEARGHAREGGEEARRLIAALTIREDALATAG